MVEQLSRRDRLATRARNWCAFGIDDWMATDVARNSVPGHRAIATHPPHRMDTGINYLFPARRGERYLYLLRRSFLSHPAKHRRRRPSN